MKRFFKSVLLVAGVCATVCMLTGCRKQCACLHNSGAVIYFSKSEVEDANGGNCSSMKMQSGEGYFAYCEWE